MSQMLMEKPLKIIDSRSHAPRVSLMEHTPPASPLFHTSPPMGQNMKTSGYSPPFTVQSLLSEPRTRRPSFPFYRPPIEMIRPPIHSTAMHTTNEMLPISPVEDDVFFSYQKRPYLVAAGNTTELPKQTSITRPVPQRNKRHHSDADLIHAKRRNSIEQEAIVMRNNNNNIHISHQHDMVKTEQSWNDIKYSSIHERRHKHDDHTVPKSISLGFHLPQWTKGTSQGEPITPESTSPKQVIPPPTSSSNSHLLSTAINQSKDTVKKEQQQASGRFRPPPFFSTVKELRQHLYSLGGRSYNDDEPPNDKRTQRLWRAMEKYNTQYSLQHYFFVASLSNRCFEKVERIVNKVHSGLLEGSREHEVNQSYFNFLYGKSEEERFRLLSLLECGEVRIKELMKKPSRTGRRSNTTDTLKNDNRLKDDQNSRIAEVPNAIDFERQIHELKAALNAKNEEIISLQKFNQKLCEQLTCIDEVTQQHKNIERRQRQKAFL